MTEPETKTAEPEQKSAELGSKSAEPETKSATSSPSKDVWDKIAALSPLISGLLIFVVGGYFTFTYNEQQIKLQELQTIEKFIPHLMGNEQSKRASILALSSLTNARTASKFAQIFASTGTVSALRSISHDAVGNDKAIADQALADALDRIAEENSTLTNVEVSYKSKLKSTQATDSDRADTAYNLNRLAQIYVIRKQYDLAEPLLKRSLLMYRDLYGSDSPPCADVLKSLSEIHYEQGKNDLAEADLKKARAIQEKLILAKPVSQAVDSGNTGNSGNSGNSGKDSTTSTDKQPEKTGKQPDSFSAQTTDQTPAQKSSN